MLCYVRHVLLVSGVFLLPLTIACGSDDGHGPTVGAPGSPVVISEGGNGPTGNGGITAGSSSLGMSGGATGVGGGTANTGVGGAFGAGTTGGADSFGVGGAQFGAPGNGVGGSDSFGVGGSSSGAPFGVAGTPSNSFSGASPF